MNMKLLATDEFSKRLKGLRDTYAKLRILARLKRAEQGNLGDTKFVGDGVHEMRIAYGKGYRLYFANVGKDVLLLLICGDKSQQKRDITSARSLLRDYERREST
jgi:putative addiction module killer protein